MTRIRANCLGEVDLRPDDVVLHIVRAATDEHIAQLRSSGGVHIAEATPSLPPHPEGPPAGPPLTRDDRLDLHLGLARDDGFSELLRAV